MADLISEIRADADAWGRELVEEYRDVLNRRGKNASYALSDSVRSVVEERGTDVCVDLNLAGHWKYIEWDTKPHFPPISAILEWVRVKPVIPRADALGRIPTERGLAYLIARKIARDGTRGGRYLTVAINDKIKVLQSKLNVTLSEWCGAQTLEDFGKLNK